MDGLCVTGIVGVAIIRYEPGTTPLMRNVPVSSLRPIKGAPVPPSRDSSSSRTMDPFSGAPVASTTKPLTW